MRYSCCSQKSEAVAIAVGRLATTKILVKDRMAMARLSGDDGDDDEHNDEIDKRMRHVKDVGYVDGLKDAWLRCGLKS